MIQKYFYENRNSTFGGKQTFFLWHKYMCIVGISLYNSFGKLLSVMILEAVKYNRKHNNSIIIFRKLYVHFKDNSFITFSILGYDIIIIILTRFLEYFSQKYKAKCKYVHIKHPSILYSLILGWIYSDF